MTGSDQQPDDPLACVVGGARVWVGGNDREARGLINRLLEARDVVYPPSGTLDVAIITPLDVEEAIYFLNKLNSRLSPGGTVVFVHGETVPESSGASALWEDLIGRAALLAWELALLPVQWDCYWFAWVTRRP